MRAAKRMPVATPAPPPLRPTARASPPTVSHVRAPLCTFGGWVPTELLRPMLELNSHAFADFFKKCAAWWRWSDDRRWPSAAPFRGADPTWPVVVADSWAEDLPRHRLLADQVAQGVELHRAPPDGFTPL